MEFDKKRFLAMYLLGFIGFTTGFLYYNGFFSHDEYTPIFIEIGVHFLIPCSIIIIVLALFHTIIWKKSFVINDTYVYIPYSFHKKKILKSDLIGYNIVKKDKIEVIYLHTAEKKFILKPIAHKGGYDACIRYLAEHNIARINS